MWDVHRSCATASVGLVFMLVECCSEGWESRRGEGSQAPLSSSMASSLEDFQEYAERLKLKAAGSESPLASRLPKSW